MKSVRYVEARFDALVNGGQAIGSLPTGQKIFAWGILPGETGRIKVTRTKKNYLEGVAEEIFESSPHRIQPVDPDSYLSTSPWQILDPAVELTTKSTLIADAFTQHHVTLPQPSEVWTDHRLYQYRNKIEFSWYGDTVDDKETLDLAFFQRGGRGKIPVDTTSLAQIPIIALAQAMRRLLADKAIAARSLKTLLVRCTQTGDVVWQLYIKDRLNDIISPDEAAALPANSGEIIYSDPRSPASCITERLACFGDISLQDQLHGVSFRYACEGFFQINLPLYEQALNDMSRHITPNNPVVDMYAGVGTIGLTIGGDQLTLVEVNQSAVHEMKQNIAALKRPAQAVLAPSEQALDYITSDATIIVDPPRAGLHGDVVDRLLAKRPPKIIYLSCNPVTQARDVALLQTAYRITENRGYNFFPRTPHIEHLVVLEAIAPMPS